MIGLRRVDWSANGHNHFLPVLSVCPPPLGQVLGHRGGKAEDGLGGHADRHEVEPLLLLLDRSDPVSRLAGGAILAPQNLACDHRILDVEGDDEMAIDDLVQGPVGRDFLIVSGPLTCLR